MAPQQRPPKTQHLVLHWPASERTDARLEIDRWPRKIADLADRKNPGLLKMEVTPGPHKVWIERRGFEPFEDTVTVERGQDATIRVQWREAPQVVVDKPQPKPEEKPKPKDVAVEKPKPEAKPEPKPLPKVDPAIVAREKKWRSAMEPVEKLTAAWDFAGAQAAIAQIRFDEPELSARLARRRDELKRMAALKAKMIARIKAARPDLKKSDLRLRGINGEVTGADDRAIHAKLSSGKTEDHPWAELNETARPKLLQLAADPQSSDDWLAAGLMAFSAGDVPLAEKLLDKARSLGADIAPYLGSLASAAFARAGTLLKQEKWSDAEKALAELQGKYGSTPWFAENRALFGAALAKARSGIYESEAEKLYAEAKKLFEEKELFDVRDIVQKLKADYPKSLAVTDAGRKPSFAEMEKATTSLGKRLIVRQDGKGDFKTIQAAIDAASPDSLIEIQDSGSYNERIVIPKGKDGMILRGKRGQWPVITSLGPTSEFPTLLAVHAKNTMISRIVLIHATPSGDAPECVRVVFGSLRLRFAIMAMGLTSAGLRSDGHAVCEVEDCLAIGSINLASKGSLHSCLVTSGEVTLGNAPTQEVRFCTFAKQLNLYNSSGCIVLNSIVETMDAQHPKHRIENCALFGRTPFKRAAKPGRNCFAANPQFANPAMLDYRLMPTSPCIGKASDGGDIGCRYTPEMIEMCKKALELRRQGIIKF